MTKLLQLSRTTGLRTVQQVVKRQSASMHSFTEPTFVYSGWHQQSRIAPSSSSGHHRSSSSFHMMDDDDNNGGTQMRDFRVMSPKETSCNNNNDEEQSPVSYDEDYDEYNLHIAPHLVTNRCQQQVHKIEALEHQDIFSLTDDKGIDSYLWNQGTDIRPDDWFNTVMASPSEDYDDYNINSVDEGELAF